MAILTTNDITYYYPKQRKATIENINLEVKENEFFSIIGPSGCGKTTLLMILNGLIPKVFGGKLRGSIIVHGKDIRDYSVAELAQTVQILFQNPESQLFAMNVEDEIAFGLENINLPYTEIRKRTKWILKMLNIPHLRKKPLEELSSGQKQIVALASILAMKPKILLLDEPTSNLDPKTIKHLYKLLKALKKQITIILVEHNIEFVKEFSDKITLMNKGNIIKTGKPEVIFLDKKFLRIMHAPQEIGKIHKEIKQKINKPVEGEKILEIKKLSFNYPNKYKALRNINATIKKGETLGIIGLNGSGKSTLALNLLGLLKPTKGSVIFRGQNIHKQGVDETSKNIGYIFQNPDYTLFEDTVLREVQFGPANLNLIKKDVKQRAIEAINRVKLEEHRKKDPHELSLGQKRRVNIASTMAMLPEILMIDEPDTGLDSKTAEKVMNYIKELNENGHTILLISHNLELINKYCNRVIYLENGRVSNNVGNFTSHLRL